MKQLQFQQKLKKILSSNYSLNEKQAIKIQVQSLSKQNFKKRKIKLKQNIQLQDGVYFLKNSYKHKMSKYNRNLIVIKKLIDQNNIIAMQLSKYSKIKEKVNIIGLIKNKLLDLKKFFLFEHDIDEQDLYKTIKDNR